jgi:hypothetical protein
MITATESGRGGRRLPDLDQSGSVDAFRPVRDSSSFAAQARLTGPSVIFGVHPHLFDAFGGNQLRDVGVHWVYSVVGQGKFPAWNH